MTYPYGARGVPVVGGGLPGLPRRNKAEIGGSSFLYEIENHLVELIENFQIIDGYNIDVGDFEAVFTTAGEYLWEVPDGVYSVSVVAVGGGRGNGDSSHFNRSLYAYGSVGQEGGGFSGADGGGYGGRGGNSGGYGGGGGGAGGYSGNGGHGANSGSRTSGAGNGGGGGGGGYDSGTGGRSGGGVGLYGRGPNGGASTFIGNPGSGGSGSSYGGGSAGSASGGAGRGGGGLGYKNNIAVAPGQLIPIKVADTGAVRIIWPGLLRIFPTINTNKTIVTNAALQETLESTLRDVRSAIAINNNFDYLRSIDGDLSGLVG